MSPEQKVQMVRALSNDLAGFMYTLPKKSGATPTCMAAPAISGTWPTWSPT